MFMPLASLLALALLTADAAPAPAALPDEPIPVGAPADDYGLVSWCAGALAGHMTLYKQVKPELDALPDPRPKETAALDAEQTKAGRDYLALYQKATAAAEKASPRPIGERGLAMRRAGYSIWTTARNTADAKARMWTWLSWELPGRCETASERLYEKSLLSAQALGIDLIGGSSAASQQPVTPQINPAPPRDSRAKAGASAVSLSNGPGSIGATAAKGKSKAPAPPAPTAPTAPPAPAIEDLIVAELQGRTDPLPTVMAAQTPPQAPSPDSPVRTAPPDPAAN
jgi:hypothetical protein